MVCVVLLGQLAAEQKASGYQNAISVVSCDAKHHSKCVLNKQNNFLCPSHKVKVGEYRLYPTAV